MSGKQWTFAVLLTMCVLLAFCAERGFGKRAKQGGKKRRIGRPTSNARAEGELATRNNTGDDTTPDVDIARQTSETESQPRRNRNPGRIRKGKKGGKKGGKKRRGRKRKNNNLVRDTLRQLFGFDHMVGPRPDRHRSREGENEPDIFDDQENSVPGTPEFMLELYRTFTDDSSKMQYYFQTQGNTVRSFFSVAGNIPSRPRDMGRPITIASVDHNNGQNHTSRQMRVYAFNVTTIPQKETIISSELRLDGQNGNRSQWSVYVGAYRIEQMGRIKSDTRMVYRRSSGLVSIRQTKKSLWQDAKLTKVVLASRAPGHVLIAKFFNGDHAPLNRIARNAPSPQTPDSTEPALPDFFVVTDTERAKRNSGDNRNRPTPMARPGVADTPPSGTPVLVVYTNETRPGDSHTPDVDFHDDLLNTTEWMAKIRARRSSQLPDNPDRPRGRNDLPNDKAPASVDKSSLGNMQTEPPSSRIMSTLKPVKQRKGKGKKRGGKRRNKKCRKGKKRKGKKKGCNNDSSMGCGRKNMLVDFQEIGWGNWIVAPHSFESYYCAGTCSLANMKDTNPTNHAIVKMHLMATNPEIPSPCCVPDKLEPISVLYFDEYDMVVLKTFHDMRVTSCRCR